MSNRKKIRRKAPDGLAVEFARLDGQLYFALFAGKVRVSEWERVPEDA